MRSILFLALLTVAIPTAAPARSCPGAFTRQAAPSLLLWARHLRQTRQSARPAAKRLAANGTTVSYWEQGRGVPVVFVHGAISDHRAWEFQREAIAKRYRYVAIDRRYYGAAAWPDDGVQLSQAMDVADLAALIRGLKAGPVFLVGASAGGVVAVATAVQHPELVRGLFVNEPGLYSVVTDPADEKVVSEFRLSARRQDVRAAAKAGKMEEAVRMFADFVNGKPGSFDAAAPVFKRMFIDNARTLTLETRPVAVTCAQLGRLKMPVTITRGATTPAAFNVMTDAAHRCIPGSRLITIPAASHGAPRQNPSAFNKALLAFLRQN